VLLDEWQEVPNVLAAVKRAVDDTNVPGQFMLTGSVRGDLDVKVWPGTGRLVRLQMSGLTMRELSKRLDGQMFVDRLSTGEFPPSVPESLDLTDYLSLAERGGFPNAAIDLDGASRHEWLESYLEQLLTRDAPSLTGTRGPHRLVRYFEAAALNTSGVPTDVTMAQASGVDRRTGRSYEELLTNLFVLDLVPAWATNRLNRLIKAPKQYLVDTGLAMAALRTGANGVLHDGDLLGRMLETFVVAQLRPELTVAQSRPRMFHLRDRGGTHEVDLLLEYAAHRIAAIEVKATSAPRLSDARHLVWLREQLGDRFICGVVLHTGTAQVELADRISALPISAIWA